jgi:NitT/TauT family transport system substrate-binding protein
MKIKSLWVLISLTLIVSSVNAQEKVPLTTLYSAINATYLSLWVGEAAGYFSQEGLDVKPVHVRGSAPIVQSMLSGHSQFGMFGATSVANAQIQGTKEPIIIAGVSNYMAYVVAARPELKGPANFKGKKMAVARFGGTSEFVVDYALKQWNLKRSDISMLIIGNEGERLAAMKAGHIDLSIFTPTLVPAIENAGIKVVLDLERLKVPYLLTGYVTTRSYLQRNRPVAIRFMRAVIKGINRIKTDRKFAGAVLAKYLRADDPEVITTAVDHQARELPDLPYPLTEGIQTILDELAAKFPEARKIRAEFLADSTIVRDAAR